MRERTKKNVMETTIKEEEERHWSRGSPAVAAGSEDHSDANCPSAGSRGLRGSRNPHCSLGEILHQSRGR